MPADSGRRDEGLARSFVDLSRLWPREPIRLQEMARTTSLLQVSVFEIQRHAPARARVKLVDHAGQSEGDKT